MLNSALHKPIGFFVKIDRRYCKLKKISMNSEENSFKFTKVQRIFSFHFEPIQLLIQIDKIDWVLKAIQIKIIRSKPITKGCKESNLSIQM